MDGSLSRCDTPYASFDTSETVEMEVNEITELVKANLGPIKHVVISGGEPLLQEEPLAKLCQYAPSLYLSLHLTIKLYQLP